jgi:hypothetical protein
VPKRMIFPETAIFLKDVATCQLAIIPSFSTTRHSHERLLCQPSGNEDLLSTSWGRLPSRRAKRHGNPQPGVIAGRSRWVIVPWEMFHVSGRGTFRLSTQCFLTSRSIHTFKKYSRKHITATYSW